MAHAASVGLFFWLLLLLFGLHFSPLLAEPENSIESVPDLHKLMYMSVDGYPCVRLLNLSGEIGCSNPGRGKVVAPIIKFRDAKDLYQMHAVLVSVDELEEFFNRISNDTRFTKQVGGVIVESGTAFHKKIKGFSPDTVFPQAEFAPYRSTGYKWNPSGTGVMWKAYDFPVYLLSKTGALVVHEMLAKKRERKKAYTTDVVEFDMVMQTTKAGTRNSESCLKEQTCLPLGGYSVWSSLPPIAEPSSAQIKPIVLVVTSMDSASFFRDRSIGADTPISGLISLLAAIDILSHADGFDKPSKQLVFLFLTGEAWGYLGSRRFMLELDLKSDYVYGLNSSQVEMVMEIASVGKGLDQGAKNFFVHKAGASSAINNTMDALKDAQDSLKSENINVQSANSTNPGVPPSSLMSFLRKDSLTSGIVLADFNTEFANKFFHSHLDDSSNINSSAVAAAATLVARTLYILARGGKHTRTSLNSLNVNVSLVNELIKCLVDCEPGLSCELVKNYISPSSRCPGNYAGVILGEPSAAPYSGYVSDMSRFLWNFLAEKTSIPKKNGATACSNGCKKKDEVCIKSETEGKGVCVISTTRYVPAYSTRLKFESGIWTVLPPNSSDPMGLLDPTWTESNWNTIGVRIYTIQDTGYDRLVLIIGICITLFAYFAIMVTRAFITKALKHD